MKRATSALIASFFILTLATFGQGVAPTPKPPEVIVIPVLPAPWIFRTKDMTPARLRAQLDILRPDVIGVATTPTWRKENRYPIGSYAAERIAAPWARSHGIADVGIDWMDEKGFEKFVTEKRRDWMSRILDRIEDGPLPLEAFGRVPAPLLAKTRDFFAAASRGAIGGDSPTAAGPTLRRVMGMAEHCFEVLSQPSCRRLVVFVGAALASRLEQTLAGRNDIRLLRLAKDVREPSQQEIDRAWTTDDLVAVLGHNLDGERSYFHPELIDLDRMDRMADRLAGRVGRNDPVVRYFRARIAFDRGEMTEALRQFVTLATTRLPAPPPRLYPYTMDEWRLSYRFDEAVAIERSRCLLRLDRRDDARRLLATIRPDVDMVATAPRAHYEDAKLLADTLFTRPNALNLEGGWFCAAAHRRHVSWKHLKDGPDDAPALRLSLLESTRGPQPLSLVQKVRVPPSLRGAKEFAFDVGLSGRGVTDIQLVASIKVSRERRIIDLARVPVSRSAVETGERQRLRFVVPKNRDHVVLCIYFRGVKGGHLDVSLPALMVGAPPPPVPPDWRARFLAAEFPRTLMAD